MKFKTLATILMLLATLTLTFAFNYCGDDDPVETTPTPATPTPSEPTKTDCIVGEDATTGEKGPGTKIAENLWDKKCLFKDYESYEGVTRDNVLALGKDLDQFWCDVTEEICSDDLDEAKIEASLNKVFSDARVSIVSPILSDALLSIDSASFPTCGDIYEGVNFVRDLKDPNNSIYSQIEGVVSSFGITKQQVVDAVIDAIDRLDKNFMLTSTLEAAGVTSADCSFIEWTEAAGAGKSIPEVWILIGDILTKETNKEKIVTDINNAVKAIKGQLVKDVAYILGKVHALIPAEKITEICGLLGLVPQLLMDLLTDVESKC